MKKSIIIIRVLWIISFALFLSGTIIAEISTEIAIPSLCTILGALITIVAKINIFIALKYRKQLLGSESLLAEGLLATIVSLILLLGKSEGTTNPAILFGTWEILSGFLKTIEAKNLSDARIRGWRGFLAIAVIELLSGITLLLNPLREILNVNEAMSIVLFIQSINFLFRISLCPHLTREEA